MNDVRRIAMSLPEVTEEPHFEYTSFRVKGKIFATAPPNGAHVHIFVAEEDREPVLMTAPDVCEKLFWGGKVRGLRVGLGKAKKPLVAELLKKAWLHKAPKALVNKLAISVKKVEAELRAICLPSSGQVRERARRGAKLTSSTPRPA